MKFGLKFREQYQKEAGGAIAEEFDNLVAFLQMLWDRVFDSEGNIKVSITDNSKGGAGTEPDYIELGDQIVIMNDAIAAAGGGGGGAGDTLAGVLNIYHETFTEAQFEALLTTPIQIVPAQAGYVHIPIIGWFEVDFTATYATSPTFTIMYGTNIAMTALSFTSLTPTATGRKTTKNIMVSAQYNYGSSDPSNKALQLTSSSNISGAGTINEGSVTLLVATVPSII